MDDYISTRRHLPSFRYPQTTTWQCLWHPSPLVQDKLKGKNWYRLFKKKKKGNKKCPQPQSNDEDILNMMEHINGDNGQNTICYSLTVRLHWLCLFPCLLFSFFSSPRQSKDVVPVSRVVIQRDPSSKDGVTFPGFGFDHLQGFWQVVCWVAGWSRVKLGIERIRLLLVVFEDGDRKSNGNDKQNHSQSC